MLPQKWLREGKLERSVFLFTEIKGQVILKMSVARGEKGSLDPNGTLSRNTEGGDKKCVDRNGQPGLVVVFSSLFSA